MLCTHVGWSIWATEELPFAFELCVVLRRGKGRERTNGLVFVVSSLDYETFEFGKVFGGESQRYGFAAFHGLAVDCQRVR